MLAAEPEAYWGYNVLVGSKDEVFHFSNRDCVISSLTSGIHGVSNATLNTPWAKVTRGKERLTKLFASNGCSATDALALMSERAVAQDAVLPRTGVSLTRERQLSALFVETPSYGTLTTSLLRLYATGKVLFTEWTHGRDRTKAPMERTERFSTKKV
jgi:uncharacterized protein with NRDE domain